MPRIDGRKFDQLRPLTITPGFMPNAEGSCLIEFGNTKVICTATVEDRVPPFLKGKGKGWVTAEYSMLPRSGKDRNQRDTRGPSGRSQEIQRLIGRSFRSVVDLGALGERQVLLDCDVLQADGGTRTAAISGSCVALMTAFDWMIRAKMIDKLPMKELIAAVSFGIYGYDSMLDLCYEEDSKAAVDMNIVMTDKGKFIEVQGTAEGAPFDRTGLNQLIDLAEVGLKQIYAAQRVALAGILK